VGETVAAIVEAHRSGASSPEATVARTYARIRAHGDPAIFITLRDEADALAEATALAANGDTDLPLYGVPFAVKDNIDVKGLPTTAACPAFAYSPERSATVVERLEAAGALLIGKTNLDQFATGLSGARSPYGACGCVYNRDFISGGSSSGSAVAVAAGLVTFALGTDTAGSGRVPAAINGLVGLKPTRGRWSTRGLTPACRTLDCISVFTATVEDAALVDGVVTGFDPEDPYSRPAPSGEAPSPTRLGAPLPSQRVFLSDRQYAGLFDRALARLADLGAEIVEVDISPLLAAARLLYAPGPWVAERAAATESLLRTNPSAIHPVVREILQQGLATSGVEAMKGQYALAGCRREAESIWRACDALVLPTSPTVYRIADMLAEPMQLNANLGLYTNFVNLLDLAALALPAGFRTDGPGFGVTLMAPAWGDRALQALGRRFEAAAVDPPPPLDLGERPADTVKLAVLGAHLAGMPLHWQLQSRGARLAAQTRTAPVYRLYAMSGVTPPKPALAHVGDGGAAIEVEVYELPLDLFGGFVAAVEAPLAIGDVTLADGARVKGFVAEPRACHGAEDITAFGGWRAYLAARG